MKKGNFDDTIGANIMYAYDRGFRFGYLAAKFGVNWPEIPEEKRKPYEDEARKTLEIWNEKCEKRC